MYHGSQTQDQSDRSKTFQGEAKKYPTGLLEKLKEHLDHMLDVGAIKPSKSAWNNVVVLVQKKDRGLRFCINF